MLIVCSQRTWTYPTPPLRKLGPFAGCEYSSSPLSPPLEELLSCSIELSTNKKCPRPLSGCFPPAVSGIPSSVTHGKFGIPKWAITEYCSHEWGPFFPFLSMWSAYTFLPSREFVSDILYKPFTHSFYIHFLLLKVSKPSAETLFGILMSPAITLPYSQRFEVFITLKPTACTLKASRKTSLMVSLETWFEIFLWVNRRSLRSIPGNGNTVGGPPVTRLMEISWNTLWEPLEHTLEAYRNTLKGPPEIRCGVSWNTLGEPQETAAGPPEDTLKGLWITTGTWGLSFQLLWWSEEERLRKLTSRTLLESLILPCSLRIAEEEGENKLAYGSQFGESSKPFPITSHPVIWHLILSWWELQIGFIAETFSFGCWISCCHF